MLTHRQTNRQTNRQADRQTDRQTNRQADKQTDRQTDRQTNRQTGRQADRQAGRQADRHYDANSRFYQFCKRACPRQKVFEIRAKISSRKSNLSTCIMIEQSFALYISVKVQKQFHNDLPLVILY
jgi:hypothetical protein